MLSEGFILKQIKKFNNRLLLWCVLILAMAAVVASGFPKYWQNMNDGPSPLSGEELNSLTDVDSLDSNYVTVEADDCYTDITDDGYLLLGINGYLLAATGNPDTEDLTFTGELINMPDSDSEKIYSALEKQGKDMEVLGGAFHPFILKTEDYENSRTFQYVLAGLLILLVIYNVYNFIRRKSNPLSHPTCKGLSALGETEALAGAIDNEVESEYGPDVKGNILITKNWIVRKGLFNLKFIPLSDTVWAYQKITTQKLYGVITTSRTYHLIICTKGKDRIATSVRKSDCEVLLQKIYEKAPWVCIGYSDKLAGYWNKNRAEFIEEIQSRYREIKQGGAEAQKSS